MSTQDRVDALVRIIAGTNDVVAKDKCMQIMSGLVPQRKYKEGITLYYDVSRKKIENLGMYLAGEAAYGYIPVVLISEDPFVSSYPYTIKLPDGSIQTCNHLNYKNEITDQDSIATDAVADVPYAE